ncbi:MAG: hypothetical protein Q8Q38_03385 [bacterium]|nr:hypothetical protein [bacterium]MDZ4232102.1 hypothetical protein [Candidatus Pacearchaeota archaeon]
MNSTIVGMPGVAAGSRIIDILLSSDLQERTARRDRHDELRQSDVLVVVQSGAAGASFQRYPPHGISPDLEGAAGYLIVPPVPEGECSPELMDMIITRARHALTAADMALNGGSGWKPARAGGPRTRHDSFV